MLMSNNCMMKNWQKRLELYDRTETNVTYGWHTVWLHRLVLHSTDHGMMLRNCAVILIRNRVLVQCTVRCLCTLHYNRATDLSVLYWASQCNLLLMHTSCVNTVSRCSCVFRFFFVLTGHAVSYLLEIVMWYFLQAEWKVISSLFVKFKKVCYWQELLTSEHYCVHYFLVCVLVDTIKYIWKLNFRFNVYRSYPLLLIRICWRSTFLRRKFRIKCLCLLIKTRNTRQRTVTWVLL